MIKTEHFSNTLDGGAERDRTADLHVANVALSQLSYCPKDLACKKRCFKKLNEQNFQNSSGEAFSRNF